MISTFHKMKRSQITVDFIIVLIIALILFLVLFSTIDKRTTQMYSLRTNLYAKEMADKVATNINTIFLAGDGTSNTLIIPETLKDLTDYELRIYPNSHIVDISWYFADSRRHYSSPILTSGIDGNTTLHDTLGIIHFTNNNGIVNVQAEVDTTPPTIWNIKNISITRNSAIITWNTNEDSNSSVAYNNYGASDKSYVLSHSVSLTGLEESTNYYYNVTSCDKYGNCATSAQYWFRTLTPESGSTVNYDFSAGMANWDFSMWNRSGDEVTPSGNYHSSGGDPGQFVSVLIPSGSDDEVGGYWEQDFVVSVDNPALVNCSFDFRIVAYDPDPILYRVLVALDNSSGTPTNLVWSNSSITSTELWSGVKSFDCSSLVASSGTYYYKLAAWVETGPVAKGSFTAGFDNAKVNWKE